MPLLVKKRQRAFRVSLVVVTGALVLLEFVTPRAPLQVLTGIVLYENPTNIDNKTMHGSNATFDDALETVTGASKSVAATLSADDSAVTAAMTPVISSDDEAEDAPKGQSNITSNGSLETAATANTSVAAKLSTHTSNLLASITPLNGTPTSLKVENAAIRNANHKMPDDLKSRIIESDVTKLNTTEKSAPNRTRIGVHERIRLKNAANAKNKYNTSAGFIHLGKTGGSTLSLQLRNGCHSWVEKPCHKVTNETIVSELVTDYYHSKCSPERRK